MHSELRIIVSCARPLPFSLLNLYTYFPPPVLSLPSKLSKKTQKCLYEELPPPLRFLNQPFARDALVYSHKPRRDRNQ
ncbi:hypothetical protein CI238_13165 [Colletotrichum incanum]|uniref:Uncharacterized protein n=1 Tax=Colletotrichum incanum TaxID=1573173 RepID=A0A167DLW8_COLIC|nr:hypothetical protein CI238_13165 [Colletotrichum incanum]